MKDQERLFSPMSGGTGTVCSCGKEFGTTDLAQQYYQWHLNIATNAYVTKRIKEELEALLRNGTTDHGTLILDKAVKDRLKELS